MHVLVPRYKKPEQFEKCKAALGAQTFTDWSLDHREDEIRGLHKECEPPSPFGSS
jgi:hypothetical protein